LGEPVTKLSEVAIGIAVGVASERWGAAGLSERPFSHCSQTHVSMEIGGGSGPSHSSRLLPMTTFRDQKTVRTLVTQSPKSELAFTGDGVLVGEMKAWGPESRVVSEIATA
jgi:hypothetical protein